jgi:hypothetical protein
MHHAPELQRESTPVAGGQGELCAAGRGQDDRVRHLQAVVLAQQHRLAGDGLIQVQPWEGVQPGFRPFLSV